MNNRLNLALHSFLNPFNFGSAVSPVRDDISHDDFASIAGAVLIAGASIWAMKHFKEILTRESSFERVERIIFARIRFCRHTKNKRSNNRFKYSDFRFRK